MFVDYHTHTSLSCDALDTMDAMCQQAIKIGLQEIAFTEHADFEPADACTGFYQPEKYFDAIETARQRYGSQLTIRAGVEIGEPHRYPDETASLLDNFHFDFVLGSLHWVADYPAFSDKFFKDRSFEAGWQSYFDELTKMCEVGDFDVLSHLDLPKRHIGPFEAQAYESAIKESLQQLVQRDKGIEINCSGLRYKAGETLPGPSVIRWYRELGGTILTLGTDSHRLAELGQGLDHAKTLAITAGFDSISTFEARFSTGHF